MSYSQPELTLATVTHNALPYTQLFLEYVTRYATIPYHLIIVDNGSTDGTVEFLQQQPEIELIVNQTNLGFAQANNQAFNRCQSPYFLGINNDTVIFPGFLKKLLATAKNHPEFGEFGVHSNCIAAKDPRSSQDLESVQFKMSEPSRKQLEQKLQAYYQDFGQFIDLFWKQNQAQNNQYSSDKNRKTSPNNNDNQTKAQADIKLVEAPPDFIGGWCFLVKTSFIRQLGQLFDNQFKIGFWEDVDLSWRIGLQNLKVGLIENLYLHHFGHVSFTQTAEFEKTVNSISPRSTMSNSSESDQVQSDQPSDQPSHQPLHQPLLKFDPHQISEQNALYFTKKWSDQIRQILSEKFSQGLSLKQICDQHFTFQAIFTFKETDQKWQEEEVRVKQNFLDQPSKNFKQFLLEKNEGSR